MNRHSSSYKRHDQLSLDDLRAYRAGQLSGAAHHRVERLLLENPFYADALDGLDALQQVGSSLTAQTRDLHAALEERIHESATTRRLMPLWVSSLAASVLLVLSVAIYLIFSPNVPEKRIGAAGRETIEPGTILIDPNDLGTSATAAVNTVPTKNEPTRRRGTLGKPARKHRRAAAISVPPAVGELPVVGNIGTSTAAADRSGESTDSARPTVVSPSLDEPIELPRTKPGAYNRHVDTERAFSDWPPGVKSISRW